MVILAEPLGARDDVLAPLTESTSWQQAVVEMIQAAAVREQQQFDPSLEAPTGLVHRGDGVAATKGMHDGGRFTAEQRRAAELLFAESGALMLASRRPVDFLVDDGRPVVLEVVIIGHTDLLVRLTALVGERFGFAGSWRFGLVVNSIRGAVSYKLASQRFYDESQAWESEFYERATNASLAELTQSPHRVVNRLVAPLLRSLGSHRNWPWLFEDEAVG